MIKDEYLKLYGQEAYERMLAQNRAWQVEHPEEVEARNKKYYEEHKEEVKARSHEQCRKDGKYYERTLEYNRTGLRGERNIIRITHANNYRPFKKIIAPESQIHHEWIPDTAEYRGIALVEAEQHMHGIVDVIEILEG